MTDMPEIHKPHEKTKTNFKTKKKQKQNKTRAGLHARKREGLVQISLK